MKRTFLTMIALSGVLSADFNRSDSIVTDSETHLQWQDDAVGTTTTWQGAIDRCEAMELGSHTDWRLPNLNELTSIMDDSRVSPAISTVFVNTEPDVYWSSTTYGLDTDYAWGVNFDSGSQFSFPKSNSFYVRCVRGGQ